MFTRILVPLDGTPEAAVALAPAVALAKATDAELTLVRVTASPDAPDAEAAAENLSRIAEEVRGTGRAAGWVLRDGDPAAEIAAEAREGGAGLVVMATHGRSGVGRAVLGSVAAGVVAQSPVPVLLLRPGGRKTTRVKTLLVPVDGSPGGALALGAALALARATGAAAHLLEVVVPVPLYAGYPADVAMPLYVDPSWDEEALASARGYVESLAAKLRHHGVEADGRAVLGQVTPTILTTAEEVDADLIVMSTHALTGPARAILGSVADAVVRAARRPVFLLRRDAPFPAPQAPRRRRRREPRTPGEPIAAGRSPRPVGFDPSA
jgi:nucleotide-binding universal stress UspA family protein